MITKHQWCTVETSLKIKQSVSELGEWLQKKKFKTTIQKLNQLKLIGDLLMMNKLILQDKENNYDLATTVFSEINLFNIYKILSNHTPGAFDPIQIPKEDLQHFLQFVKKKMKKDKLQIQLSDLDFKEPIVVQFNQNYDFTKIKIDQSLIQEMDGFFY